MDRVKRKSCFRACFTWSWFRPSCTCAKSHRGICPPFKHSIGLQWFCLRTAKVLIRLQGCAGWSGPSLSAYARRQVFAWHSPNGMEYWDTEFDLRIRSHIFLSDNSRRRITHRHATSFSFQLGHGPAIIIFFVLNSAEHDVCPANQSQITHKCKFFLAKNSVKFSS